MECELKEYILDALSDEDKPTMDEKVKDALVERLEGDENVVLDADNNKGATPPEGSLQKHDEVKHPGGFNPETDTCKFREKIMEGGKELEETELLVKDRVGKSKEKKQEAKREGVTPEEDAAYMEAVEKGDMEAAAKMVRNAAAKAMPTSNVVDKDGAPIKNYHFTKSELPFTVFNSDKSGPGMYGPSFYFFTERGMAENWGNFDNAKRNILQTYLDIRKPYVDSLFGYDDNNDFDKHKLKEATDKQYEQLVDKLKANGYEIDPNYNYGGRRPYEYSKGKKILINQGLAFLSNALTSKEEKGNWGWKHAKAVKEALEELGYDGVIGELDSYTQIAAFNPSQIKSAEPVTYYDDGSVVPLSKRFGGGDDIRFAIGKDEPFPYEQGKADGKETEAKPKQKLSEVIGIAAKGEQAEPPKKIEGLSNKAEKKFREGLTKKHPELDVDLVLTEIGKIKDKTLQKDAFVWVMKGAVRLPEDMYKVEQARELATKAKKDPLSYDTPQACINELLGEGHKVSLKPITVDELKKNPLMSDYRDEGYGVETFQVEDSREGQKLMRQVIDTHWGKDANPWCLLARQHRDEQITPEFWDYMLKEHGGNQLEATSNFAASPKSWRAQYEHETGKTATFIPDQLENAWERWNHYGALPKRVAFKDGKLLAFMATAGNNLSAEAESHRQEWRESEDYRKYDMPFDNWLENNYPESVDRPGEEWWDRNDKPHRGLTIGNVPIKDDEFGRWADIEIVEGKPIRISDYHKGEIGDNNYLAWHDNGQLRQKNEGSIIKSWYKNGQQDEIRDKENLHFEGWYEDGKKRFVEDRKTGLYKSWYPDGLKRTDHVGDLKKGWYPNGKREAFEKPGIGSIRWDENGNIESVAIRTNRLERNNDGTYRISCVEGEVYNTGILKNGKIQTVKQDNRTVPPERKAKVMQILSDVVSSCLEADKKGKREVENQKI